MKSFALLVAAAGPAALVSTLGRVPVDAAWVERLGWTLIHTIWQFALVALVAAVLQRGLRRHSARARYAAGVVLLGAMAVAPGITCCVVDVTRPSEVKHARLAPTRTPDETPSRNALPFPRSPMDESDASESSVQAATPIRHAADPLAAVGTHAAPRERPSFSWVATFRSKLAPQLPLIVSLWLAGMALFSLRPVWGLWMQWRLRRVGLSPVPASVAQCLDDLAQRLGLRRTVGIAQSVRVGAPMAVGYLRPLILLPGCVLTGLSVAQLEALLAHELAHIRRHDWLVNAFQLLVETVFFYHPAVWWLSRQIRQEREHCCDDLAVLLVGDRGTVGRMLLALEELREQTPALSLAATGGNLLGRVRRVVAKGRQPEPPGREWLPAAVLLLLAGLGGAAWAMSAGTADTKNPPPAAPTTAAPVATAKSSDRSESKRDAKNHVSPIAKTLDVRRITGRVVDSQGQPVKAARLWWVVLDDPVNEQFIVKGTSDAQGRFALEAPADWKPRRPARFPANMLWVFASGKELTVVRATRPTAGDDKDKQKEQDAPLAISLAPATETEYTVADEQGRPVAGAVLDPWRYRTPRGIDLVLSGVRDLLRRTTDSSGRVRLNSLSREALSDVQIRAAHFGTQLQWLNAPDEASPEGKITLRATGRIEGRLIADDPQSVRGVQLMFSTQHRQQSSQTLPVTLLDGTKKHRVVYGTDGIALVETDAQGRFRIPEIAAGPIFIVDGPTKSPFVPRTPSGLKLKAGETVHIDIPMERLVLVKGTIRTDEPPAALAGAEVTIRYGKRFQAKMVTSDRQGHYEAHVLAGSIYTQVTTMPRELSTRYEQTGEPWNDKIEVPAGQKEFDLPPIVLAATAARTGTLLDQRGRPFAGARVSGMHGNRRYGFAETNARGEFSLQLPKKLGMNSYNVQIPGKNLVQIPATIIKYEPFTLQLDQTAPDGKSAKSRHHLAPTGTDKRQKTDEGQPGASTTAVPTDSKRPAVRTSDVRRVTGRVVDGNGQPVSAARLWWVVLHFSLNDEFTVTGISDAQGRFALEAPTVWKRRPATRPLADMLWVFAPGKDLKVVGATDGLTVDGKDSPLVISLAPATETEYEIRDEQGHSVVRAVAEPRQFVARGVWWPFPTALRELLRRTTDQSGRVQLTSLPREDFGTLDIRAPGFGTQQQRLDGPDEASPKRKITLRQTGSIEGRLVADDPQMVRGVNLRFRTERKRYWSPAVVPETNGGSGCRDGQARSFWYPGNRHGAGIHFGRQAAE